jgi:hypothetical protein
MDVSCPMDCKHIIHNSRKGCLEQGQKWQDQGVGGECGWYTSSAPSSSDTAVAAEALGALDATAA